MEVLLLVEVPLLLRGVQSPPPESSNILRFVAVDVSHLPQSVWLNDDALRNMLAMLNTLDTSHLEMSILNDDAE